MIANIPIVLGLSRCLLLCPSFPKAYELLLCTSFNYCASSLDGLHAAASLMSCGPSLTGPASPDSTLLHLSGPIVPQSHGLDPPFSPARRPSLCPQPAYHHQCTQRRLSCSVFRLLESCTRLSIPRPPTVVAASIS